MTTLEIANLGTFESWLWESGSGAPLLYLHGYERHPGTASFLQRLAGTRRVLAPELPGFGHSTGFHHFTDVLDVVLFYRELVKSWGIDRIDVVGHSLGGMFAAELAAIAPHLVAKLVLVNAFGLWLDREPAPDPFGAPDAVRAAKWHAEPPEDEPTNFTAVPDDPHAAILFTTRNLGCATKFLWPIADRGLRRRLPLIEAPTLVVHGSSDGLLPNSYAEEFTRLIPDASLEFVAAAGHYPMVEQEDRFMSVVQRFLDA